MKIKAITQNFGKKAAVLFVNDLPSKVVNKGYDTYSRFYKGQIDLGLPVSKELMLSRQKKQSHAVGKLALSMYYIYLKATGEKIERDKIKKIIVGELTNGHIRLTEDVILLTTESLTYITLELFNIEEKYLDDVIAEAKRRFILKESIVNNRRTPAYLESLIDEREINGRGDYQFVFYREFTEDGKEIGYRRIISMGDVVAGDDKPSVILVPGFANNSNCFNLSNRYSFAKNLADKNAWVYLFDPRVLGVNTGKIDPDYTVDTMIDFDLPAVLNSVYSGSNKKPSILLGHSMGGVVSENMVLNWGIRKKFDDYNLLADDEKEILNDALPSLEEAENGLKKVKGIISLGSPKFFERDSHLVFPMALWLNHISRFFNFYHIPFKESSRVLTEYPVLKNVIRFLSNKNIGDLNFLTSPENHTEDKYFMERYLKIAMESIPLGLGFQCLMAIYSGNGFKRLDKSNLNYSESFSFFPEEIPVFHIWGSKDVLAPLSNLKYSDYYPHKIKKTFYLENAADLKNIELSDEPGQLVDFVIDGANHIDLLYGKAADEFVHPLVEMIIDKVWKNWKYE